MVPNENEADDFKENFISARCLTSDTATRQRKVTAWVVALHPFLQDHSLYLLQGRTTYFHKLAFITAWTPIKCYLLGDLDQLGGRAQSSKGSVYFFGNNCLELLPDIHARKCLNRFYRIFPAIV